MVPPFLAGNFVSRFKTVMRTSWLSTNHGTQCSHEYSLVVYFAANIDLCRRRYLWTD